MQVLSNFELLFDHNTQLLGKHNIFEATWFGYKYRKLSWPSGVKWFYSGWINGNLYCLSIQVFVLQITLHVAANLHQTLTLLCQAMSNSYQVDTRDRNHDYLSTHVIFCYNMHINHCTYYLCFDNSKYHGNIDGWRINVNWCARN